MASTAFIQSQLYETGIVLMALASAGDASLTSEVGGFGLYGRTYGDIAQDMADFLAFAQNEPDVGVWRGGWRYAPNYSQSDMSVTQWPVIGFEAAESNFGTSVPQYVKDELVDIPDRGSGSKRRFRLHGPRRKRCPDRGGYCLPGMDRCAFDRCKGDIGDQLYRQQLGIGQPREPVCHVCGNEGYARV